MTSRSRFAFALLALLAAGLLVAGLFNGSTGDETDGPGVSELDPVPGGTDPDPGGPTAGVSEGPGVPTTVPSEGTAPTEVIAPRAGGMQPGMRTPSGLDLSDPEQWREHLLGVLAATPTDWSELTRVLRVSKERLPQEARDFFLAELRDGRRRHSLEALAVIQDGSMVRDLVSLLDEPDLSNRAYRNILQALYTMPGGDAGEVVQALESRLTQDISSDRKALHAIAAKGGKEAARVLVEYVQNASEPGAIAQFILQSLDVKDDPEAAEVVIDALSVDQLDPRVGQRLLFMVGQRGATQFTAVVKGLDVDGQSDAVRQEALRTLARIGGEEAVAYLLERSSEPGAYGEQALVNLGQVSSAEPEGRKFLLEAFERAGSEPNSAATQASILKALANLREPSAATVFAKHLDSNTPEIRQAAIRGLARLGAGARSYVPRLVDEFTVSGETTKLRIAVALGSIGGEGAIKAMEQMVSVEDLSPSLHRTLRMGLLDAKKRRTEPASTPGAGARPGLGGG